MGCLLLTPKQPEQDERCSGCLLGWGFAKVSGYLKTAETETSGSPEQKGAIQQSERTDFIWDGSHLLQEIHPKGRYTYVYRDPGSYEPLAQIYNDTNQEDESCQEINYFHCDQIGLPREMTDRAGKLIWYGDYSAWGKLRQETKLAHAHQPFRLQNQYCDRETGLHYNFFGYYDPDCGRFVTQDPIGLAGSENLYRYAPNVQVWMDYLGLEAFKCVAKEKEGGGGLGYRDDRKLCIYTCTNMATQQSTDIVSNSDISDGSSRYCRGAVISTTYSPLTGGVVGHATGYESFNINTDSWYWDGWGGTSDIYNQLKGLAK